LIYFYIGNCLGGRKRYSHTVGVSLAAAYRLGKWGPYLSEQQWGTVRENYSSNGDTGQPRLADLLSAVCYSREGKNLHERGLYPDLQPWPYHIFTLEVTP
jgi:hypothetical protein